MSINYFINNINNNNLGYNSYEYFLKSGLLKLNQKNHNQNIYVISNGYFPEYIATVRLKKEGDFLSSIKKDIDNQFEIAKNRISLSDSVIYFYPYEPFDFKEHNIIFDYIQSKTTKTIKFVINNNKIKKQNYIHFDFFRYDFYSAKKEYNINNFVFAKKFIFLNNKQNNTREKLYNFITANDDLKNNSFYSFLFKNKTLDDTDFNKNFLDICSGETDFYKTHSRFLQDDYLSNNIRKYFKFSFLYVITESVPEIESNFITEKTYKAFYHGVPFLLINSAYSLEYLKTLGFKTFDKWFDESYDKEINLEIRINKVFNEIKRINLLSITELIKIKKEMMEILKYNRDHYLNNLNNGFINFFTNL